MGRWEDASFFFHLDELRDLTGYSAKRLNEIVRRYRERPAPNGKERRCFYLKEAKIANDEFAGWLLAGRFYAAFTPVRPRDMITLKQATKEGLSYAGLRRRVQAGSLEACVYRGRYYVERTGAHALSETFRLARAPADWFPVICLTKLSGRTRQAVYAWVGRRSHTRLFVHPGRSQLAQYIPVRDALDYLAGVFGKSHKVIKLLAQHARKYFRSLSKTTIDLFLVEKSREQLDPETLDVTFNTLKAQPPPFNPSQLGHELLSLRT